MSREQYVEMFGSEGAELIMWLVMRGAMDRDVVVRHKHYFVPASMTGAGMIVLGEQGVRRAGGGGVTPMYWLMICRHRPDVESLRAEHRDAHRTHVATGGGGLAKVLIGSALTEDDGETPIGNFGVLEAPTREAAWPSPRGPLRSARESSSASRSSALASRFQAHRIDPDDAPGR